jgi:hypothetical protein
LNIDLISDIASLFSWEFDFLPLYSLSFFRWNLIAGYRPSCHWLFPYRTPADSIVSQLASRVAVPEVPEFVAHIAYSVSFFS